MKRLYENIIESHFEEDGLMLFLSGPRQVGKTTTACKAAAKLTKKLVYLNWDDQDHREIILKGPKAIIDYMNIAEVSEEKPILILDEIHKYTHWKNFIKGLFDTYNKKVNFIITGSARLDIYKKGGDSLMGRYFPYKMHPLSVGEYLCPDLRSSEIIMPKQIKDEDFNHLFKFGGFPKPLLKRSVQFNNRWQRLRNQQLLQEDIRDIKNIQDIDRLEVLAKIIAEQSSQLLTYSNLAKKIRASVDTVTRWINVLESFYYCFRIRPWSKNVVRSLIKEPKVFLWDWSTVKKPGSKAENFIASHLLKSVHFWTDMGFGDFQLHYIRDFEKKEVDFLVCKDDEPWFLVEVKNSNDTKISKNLHIFKEMTGAKHSFQVVLNKDFVNVNCFEHLEPVIVPAKTFLSQLI